MRKAIPLKCCDNTVDLFYAKRPAGSLVFDHGRDEPAGRCVILDDDMKILVIGLGNPILGDDGVGWKVAEAVSNSLFPRPSLPPKDGGNNIEVDCASLGGLSLMERMIGYERVILIDSMETGGILSVA